MTKSPLIRLTRLWQKRLRLQDWKITPEIVAPATIEGNLGYSIIDAEEMTSDVKISEEAPLEETLIHELLHIWLLDWDVPEEYFLPKEKAISVLANCFVNSYPKKRTNNGRNNGSASDKGAGGDN